MNISLADWAQRAADFQAEANKLGFGDPKDARVKELEAECDQWQKKLDEVWAEVKSLRTENGRLTVALTHEVGFRERAEAQVQELTEILDSHRVWPSDGSLPRWVCDA